MHTGSKKDFARRISAHCGTLNIQQSLDALNALCEIIREDVASGKMVFIPEFGIFDSVLWKAHLAYDPQHGGKVSIPEQRKVRFKPSALFRRMVAHGPSE